MCCTLMSDQRRRLGLVNVEAALEASLSRHSFFLTLFSMCMAGNSVLHPDVGPAEEAGLNVEAALEASL